MGSRHTQHTAFRDPRRALDVPHARAAHFLSGLDSIKRHLSLGPGVFGRNSVATHNLVPQDPSRVPVRTDRWPCLRLLFKNLFIHSSLNVFPPLKSAIYGLSNSVKLFDVGQDKLTLFPSYLTFNSVHLYTQSVPPGRSVQEEPFGEMDFLLGELGSHLGNMDNAHITGSVKNLCRRLEEEVEQLHSTHVSKFTQRSTERFDDFEGVITCCWRIQGYLKRLVLNVNTGMRGMGELEDLMRKLAPEGKAASNDLVLVNRPAPCMPGTREELISHILDWARDRTPNPQSICWMSGMAGTGKTSISASLCTRLEESSDLGASFFCSRTLSGSQEVKRIIPSIAYQLSLFSRPFRSALSTIVEEKANAFRLTLGEQFECLLVEPLIRAKDTLPRDLVIVIDALDQCGSGCGVAELLDILLFHTTYPYIPLRFFFSSRPEPEIYYRFTSQIGKSLGPHLVLHDLDPKIVKRDIQTYVQAELASINSEPPQVLHLVELSGNFFPFAVAMIRHIKGQTLLRENSEQLTQPLTSSLGFVSGSYREVDQLYSTVLQEVFRNKDPESSLPAKLKVFLDTIVCAQAPININDLASLLGEENSEEMENLLRRLSSVLNIKGPNGMIEALHPSFYGYMLDPRRSAPFHCDSAATHARMACLCLKIINNTNPCFNICLLPSSYQRDSEVPSLAERSDKLLSSLLCYVCRHWARHLELGGKLQDSELMLWNFFSQRLLLWMEIMNLKKIMKFGPEMMLRAVNWSRSNYCSGEVIEFAHDGYRFVATFARHAVSQSTPHIYVSMIPFWPPSTPIAKHYSSRLRGLIQPQGPAIAVQKMRPLKLSSNTRIQTVSFHPNGCLLALGSSFSVRVVNELTSETVYGPLLHDGIVRSVAFSSDGALLVSGSEDKTIRVWSINNGRPFVRPLIGHDNHITSVRFFPNSARIASGSADGTIKIWDLKDGGIVPIRLIKAHAGWVKAICVSPDGTLIASGSRDTKVRVWSARNGSLVFDPLNGHAGMVRSVCFSPDGRRIASGSDDGTIRVWDALERREAIVVLKGHDQRVYSVAFSPDGRQIASGSLDCTLRVWDVADDSPQTMRVFRGHSNAINSVGFNYDGTYIVTGSIDTDVRIWDTRYRGPALGSFEGCTSPSGPAAAEFSEDQPEKPLSPEEWTLQEDGWAVDSRSSELLAWVPPDLRQGNNTEQLILLGLEHAHIGQSWILLFQH